MGKQYVYLMVAGSDGRKKLKIGHTWNIRLRMTQHARAQKKRMTLMAYLAQEDTFKARETEQRLHNEFRPRGSISEWHPFNPEIIRRFQQQRGCVVCL